MTLQNINFDKKTLMLGKIKIPSIAFASALASQIYEGFKPTEKSVSLIADYADGKITLDQLADAAKARLYV